MIQLNDDIIDHIMDNLIEMSTNKSKVLSTVAFWGSHWRYRVNQRRFRDLLLGKKAAKLEAVLNTSVWDHWKSDEGVIQHVRSVCLLVDLDPNATRQDIDTLSNILHILFIKDCRPFPTAPISLTINRRLFGYSSQPNLPLHIDLKKLDHNLADTLCKIICTSSRVSHLSLKGIVNVPHKLSASIQHLTLHSTVEFDCSEKYPVEFPHIETLSVIGYPDFPPWLSSSDWNAPSLRHVRLSDVSAVDANKIMARVGPQITCVEFCGPPNSFNATIKYAKELLTINYFVEPKQEMQFDTPYVTAFDDIANALPRYLPADVILNVILDGTYGPQSDIEGYIKERYEELYSAVLIDLFEKKACLESRVKLNIIIPDNDEYDEGSTMQVRKGLQSLFSDLDRIPRLELVIAVSEQGSQILDY